MILHHATDLSQKLKDIEKNVTKISQRRIDFSNTNDNNRYQIVLYKFHTKKVSTTSYNITNNTIRSENQPIVNFKHLNNFDEIKIY